MDNLKTVSEAAELLNVSIDTIRRWDKRKMIKSYRSPKNYRLFNLEEIERLNNKINGKDTTNYYTILKSPSTKYKVIELFAGGGGTANGFHNAGLQHVHASDIDKDSADTLKNNLKDGEILCEDVKVLNNTNYFKKIKADIVQGGFPCQAFSYAGKKLGFEDTRGTLFHEFARCVKTVKPTIAIGENVRGLHRHDEGRTLKTMLNSLREIGYRVSYTIMRAQYLDVPQKRERLIIYAIRDLKKNKNIKFLKPKEKDYTIPIRDALKKCPLSEGAKYPDRKKEILSHVPQGGYWRDLPLELQKEYMRKSFYLGGGKTGMARRLSWDEPSLTLTCAPAQKQTERCHPDETRPLTVREYARIQVFPDNWAFSGSLSSQYKQIGNAVPVNLAYHIGRCVISMLDKKYDKSQMEEFEEWFPNSQLNIF